MGDGKDDPPKPRDPAKDYGKMLRTYLDTLPQLLEAEQGARDQYDPYRLENQLLLEDAYGPLFDEERIERYRAYDPHSEHIRGQMADAIYKDLESGYELPDDYRIELENDIRGAQTARGNYMGTGAIVAEALYKGRARDQRRQTAIANAGRFLGTPTLLQQSNQLAPIVPDRNAAYTMGGLQTAQQGVGWGQQAFSQQLQAYQVQQSQPNPWSSAASTGISTYGATGDPWLALAGAAVSYYGAS